MPLTVHIIDLPDRVLIENDAGDPDLLIEIIRVDVHIAFLVAVRAAECKKYAFVPGEQGLHIVCRSDGFRCNGRIVRSFFAVGIVDGPDGEIGRAVAVSQDNEEFFIILRIHHGDIVRPVSVLQLRVAGNKSLPALGLQNPDGTDDSFESQLIQSAVFQYGDFNAVFIAKASYLNLTEIDTGGVIILGQRRPAIFPQMVLGQRQLTQRLHVELAGGGDVDADLRLRFALFHKIILAPQLRHGVEGADKQVRVHALCGEHSVQNHRRHSSVCVVLSPQGDGQPVALLDKAPCFGFQLSRILIPFSLGDAYAVVLQNDFQRAAVVEIADNIPGSAERGTVRQHGVIDGPEGVRGLGAGDPGPCRHQDKSQHQGQQNDG